MKSFRSSNNCTALQKTKKQNTKKTLTQLSVINHLWFGRFRQYPQYVMAITKLDFSTLLLS